MRLRVTHSIGITQQPRNMTSRCLKHDMMMPEAPKIWLLFSAWKQKNLCLFSTGKHVVLRCTCGGWNHPVWRHLTWVEMMYRVVTCAACKIVCTGYRPLLQNIVSVIGKIFSFDMSGNDISCRDMCCLLHVTSWNVVSRHHDSSWRVLLFFVELVLGNRHVRSRGFIVGDPRETRHVVS